MAGKNKKTESDFIKELEALEQQKKEATEQLKAYLKSQTDKLGQIYFELKKLENPDLSIDELVVETQNKVKEVKKEVKKEIKQRKAEEKERMLRRLIKKRIMTLKNRKKELKVQLFNNIFTLPRYCSLEANQYHALVHPLTQKRKVLFH